MEKLTYGHPACHRPARCLADAYYLAANHGITNVAVLDKRYIGSGGSGRNTTILVRDDVAGVRSYLLYGERSSGRYLFDVLVSVSHDFGIEIDGFHAPGI